MMKLHKTAFINRCVFDGHHHHVRLLKTMTNRIVTTGKTMNEKLKLINRSLYKKNILVVK